MKNFTNRILWLMLALGIVLVSFVPQQAQAQLGSRVVVGYFHNWNAAQAPYIRLRDVNPKYNVINVAFATPVSFTDMTMTFAPTQQTKAEFISDIQFLQSQGRRVQISIGGAEAPVELKTIADRDKFITSMKAIITEYGFNGYDIDLEGTSVILDNGDTNFKSPTTPKINNLIFASREIVNFFRGQGKDFWLTSAPETQYVQGGYGNYGSAFGGYLPVLYALRDILTFVHVQYYNTGSQVALDEKVYGQSTADFIVSMTDMLLRGFPVARNTANVFPALREDQVAFGLPATNTGAAPAGGYVAPAELNKALNYLVKGISYGSQYVTPKAYPGLRGIMTWSVNWDKTTGDAWVNNAYAFFSGLGGNVFPTVSITSPANNATFATGATINIAANAGDSDGTISKVDFFNGSTLLGTDTSSPYNFSWTNVPAGNYSLTARATDNQSAATTSGAISITVGTTNTAPTANITSPSNGATFDAPASITINVTASDPGGSVASVSFYNGASLLGTDTSSPYSFTWNNVGAGTYSLTAVATDNTNLTGTSPAVSVTVNNLAVQSPYGGTARNLPGRIEGEHYDVGGQSVAYNDLTTGNSGNAFRTDNVDLEATTDAGGGFNVGWIQAGEWLEYTVNVTTAGTYTLSARVAAISAGKTFHAELDGVNISGTLTVPNTGGWQTWQTVTATTPSLTTGQKILRIFADQGDFNVNYVEFTSSGNPAPVTSITSPSNGTTFTSPANITINATASDNGSVTKVEFYNGNALLGTDTSSPYSFSWTNVGTGTYSLTTRATDNQGAIGTSAAVSITVTGSNSPPVTNIQYPGNGQNFTAPASFTIIAVASDANGTVTKVDFYNGTTLLGTATTSPYGFAWNNVPAGTYTLTTKATDNQGAVGTSAPVTINVTGSGCSAPQYVENGGYVAGSRVKNVGNQYECKPHPFTGWCNGAAWAYAPGTGTYWTDAWILIGSCSGRQAQPHAEELLVTEDKLVVAPNPGVSGKAHTLTLSFADDAGTVSVQLINVSGKSILSSRHEQVKRSLKVEVPALPGGLYILRVRNATRTQTAKYIVE